ncbi:porin family protein [Mariniflexile litorale]|uniref:Porin family protein n=1 Tax=Mariniflexile litorale TaxID=3045158 RepID=A0AAU7EF17_9FLAO|nr:porin family protein [Mariniflexile sp. KMM 9835]MDQ8213112.1 porin family protein [Mariniflexile sp. KMM 9835]
MKKLLLGAVIAVFAMSNVNAQETTFGLKAGADFASSKLKMEGISLTGSETGFYIGAFAEIGLSDSFTFQPEVLYVSIEGFDQVSIPLMAKIALSEKFDALVGPSLGFLLDSEEGYKSFNYGIEAGVAYDLTEDLFLEARYNMGLANLIEDAPSGYSSKISGLFVGLGYRF